MTNEFNPDPRRRELTEEEKKVRQTPFSDRYGWQFKALFAYGWAIAPGWNNEVQQVLEFVENLITDPADRAIFSWHQIKEKMGGLRMYARMELPFSSDGMNKDEARDVVDLLKILAGDRFDAEDPCFRLSEGIREAIHGRIKEVADRCNSICEACGQPGKLIQTGWHRVSCQMCEAARIAKAEDES